MEIVVIRIKAVCELKARLMAKHLKPITVIAFYKLFYNSVILPVLRKFKFVKYILTPSFPNKK